jgi:hypothetical protein
LIVGVTVAAYIALGLALHLNTDEYLLLGIPILAVFQLTIHRQPIRAMWVRSAPPIRIDPPFIALWMLFSIVPAYEGVVAVANRNFAYAALALAAVAGAFGAAYSVHAFRRRTVAHLLLCLATITAIGILPSLLSTLLPHVVPLHLSGRPTGPSSAPLAVLRAAAAAFLFWPVGFAVEEVFFRGALDTYLHPRSKRGAGWISAIFVSALWGLWHLPGQLTTGSSPSHLLVGAAGLVLSQVLIGVPLSLWWRKSGNLVVTDVPHAFLEAARTIPQLTV